MKKIIYTVLFLISGILFLINYLYHSNYWVTSYIPNFVVSLLTIIVTIIFVDYLLEKDRIKEKNKFSVIAYKKLSNSINRFVELMAQLVQASMNKDPQNIFPATYQELLSEKYLKELDYFDFKKGTAPIFPIQTWTDYIPNEVKSNIEDINKTIDRYIPYLSSTIIDLTYRIEKDPFLAILQNIQTIQKIPSLPNQFLILRGLDQFIKEFSLTLLEIIRKISDDNPNIKISYNQEWFSNSGRIGESRYTEKE